jgi:leucyl/phenylalanyl-tRNA--protein transferase
MNRDFDEVVERCRIGRKPQWLTDRLVACFKLLHKQGWAYSVELWDGDELIAGGFGIARGAVVSIDSVFHPGANVARLLVVETVHRFADTGPELLDVQWPSPLLTSLGARGMKESVFVARVQASSAPVRPDDRTLPISRLCGWTS